MKNKLLFLLCTMLALSTTNLAYSQETDKEVSSSDPVVVAVDSLISNKEEKNRNEMLNAENNPGPRQVNIGLPFNGDIIILENDVPVVYTFWPTVPTLAWRYDNSLSKMGLLSFAEGALTFGKVGYAVASSDRDASPTFKGYATIYGNSFGTSRYDVTVTGPMGDNGWGYMLSTHQAFDKGIGANFMFTPWFDRTQMVKAAIQKKYNKGNVRLLYKFSDVKTLFANYMPVKYEGNGKTSSLDNFQLGRDSYLVRDGKVPYYDLEGNAHEGDLGSSQFSRSQSHNIYLTGEHKFNKGYRLTYSSMFQTMNSPFSIVIPLSVMTFDTDQQGQDKYYYHGTQNEYEGPVQWTINQLIPQSKNKTWITRAELTKKINNHSLRLGFTNQFNKYKLTCYGGAMVQTIEANPQKLDYSMYMAQYGMYIPMTNEYGGLPAAISGYSYMEDKTINKTALYFSDDFDITKALSVGFGARIEHQHLKENKYTFTNEFMTDSSDPWVKDTKNQWNKVGTANFVYKINHRFGILGDITYNDWHENYWDYPNRDDNGNPIGEPGTNNAARQSVAKSFKNEVLNFGGGVFYNHGNLFSVVSKVTRISKKNVKSNNSNITDPITGARRNFDPLFYDISTLGWSTDIVANPFKGFNIHFLLTLQSPKYKNYEISAFDVTYNYTNNTIPELSKVLMEIDPSYSFMNGAMRVWMSLRYYGKQYANATNAFYYNARWENFGGINYRVNRNLNLKFQVTNFLNQKGVRGAMQGGDQLTSDAGYINRVFVANGIRPRTFELSADIKF